MFAEVVLAKVTRHLDKAFHYSIPKELESKLQIGHEVVVPFGRRQTIGYVIGFVDKPDVARVKDIIKISSEIPLFSEKQLELAKWIAEYYCSFLSSALKLMMPPQGKTSNSQPQTSKQITNTKSQIPNLTAEQQQAVEEILRAENDKFLLYGVTGSGKTEVYMRVIARVLEQGESAIVLVPEIGLTPQMVERFVGRFGDHVALLHSSLTLKQRSIEWQRVAKGSARIVLGTRSAIFAPVKNLGVIVIDEEFENSYKQDRSPRYHAREVAFFLAEQHNAVVVMGTATPSIETYYQAELGNYKKLVLSERIDSRPMPTVEIVDMRKAKGFILSDRLRQALKETLERKEQAILFINRRGYFTFVMCKDCGYTVKCPACSVALTYHTTEKQLVCNHCGLKVAAPAICPQCNSSSLIYLGTGTQRIEKEVADICPTARVLRYDRDAVTRRGSHELIFQTFGQGRADVLIGTQMVTKGLDVAKVTLVGIVAADTALYLPDLRSAEHTFQLLTQVAGRAGRHHLPGKVIIQTHNPEHYAICAAAKHDYEEFYAQEIKHRQELGYPPFSKLVSILVSGKTESKVNKIIEDIKVFLKKRIHEGVLGPAPAVLPRVRGEWRYHILIKSTDLDKIRRAIAETLEKVVVPVDIRVVVDVEPMSLA